MSSDSGFITPGERDKGEVLFDGGGTADCYKLIQDNRIYCVKRPKPQFCDSEAYMSLFQKEFELGAHLDHPNIVRYYDYSTDEKGPYIRMEYVDGDNLEEFAAQHPDYFEDKKNRKRFVEELLSALEYLHGKKMLHLDLKPRNILITRKYHEVKLIDLGFGWSESFLYDLGYTRDYCAPEQLASKTDQFSTATDVYALGKILQHFGLAKNHVIQRCLKEVPLERFQSVAELRRAIKQSEQKGKARYALLGLVVLVLIGGALWFYFGHKDDPVLPSVPEGAINGLYTINEAGDQVYFSKGNLQYQASTDTWRFAENQWDYLGEENTQASPDYDGWIDLFSWGASGYNHGANCYQPWEKGDQFDHAAYYHNHYDLCDETGQADWGYNAIGNGGGQERTWRTLRSSEWVYLFKTRVTATSMRYAKAMVNGVNGLVLLPDHWNASVYHLNQANKGDVPYDVNDIPLEDWTNLLEANGAVFLPAAGMYQDLDHRFNEQGTYWSATSGENAWIKSIFDFDENYFHAFAGYYSSCRHSVRLVRSSQPTSSIEVAPNPSEGGLVTGQGTYRNGEVCTLTAAPSPEYVFLYWTENGKVVSTSNPFSFAVGFNRNIKAVFDEESSFPLIYSYDDPTLWANVVGHFDGQHATGDIVIPEKVNHFGNTYTITSIGENAFVASKIRSVDIPSSLMEIGDYGFFECPSLASITVHAEVPPEMGFRAFACVDTGIPIYIPKGTLSAYQNADGWNAFTNYIEMP
jgi:serine/threonine protein kinase